MSIPLEVQIKPFFLLVILVSIISLIIVYSKVNVNIGNRREIIAFKGMIISFMVFSIIDLRQLFGDSFFTSFPYLFKCAVIAIGFASMSFSCYFWFMHVFASITISPDYKKIGPIPLWEILGHTPIVICLLLLFTPLHYFVYDPVDAETLFKPGATLLLLLDYVYLILATGISIYCKRRSKTRIEKKKYSSQIIFILCFTASGLMIGFMLNLPAIELCFIPIVLKLFVELQDSQIYTDVLTKLYNRRRMTEFITEEISTCSQDDPLSIIMIDLDYFKNINDILGHDEGDNTLVYFSNAIQDSIKSRNALAARWGGDEFLVAGKDKELAREFRNKLQTEVDKITNLRYTPAFSVGIYDCTSPDMTIEQALIQADSSLYKDKEIHHQNADVYISELNSLKK